VPCFVDSRCTYAFSFSLRHQKLSAEALCVFVSALECVRASVLPEKFVSGGKTVVDNVVDWSTTKVSTRPDVQNVEITRRS